MYSNAPEMTPVSYPNNSPPNVEIAVSLMRNRFCAGEAGPDGAAAPP
jgi:hypothetical protein